MAENVREKVIAIIAEHAAIRPEDVPLDARLDELGIDSLGVVEAIFAIEETFGISVPFNANDPAQSGFDVSSVGAVIRAVQDLVDSQPIR